MPALIERHVTSGPPSAALTVAVEDEVAPENLSVSQLAGRVRAQKQAVEDAERELFASALLWGHAHPVLDEDTGQPVPAETVDAQALAAHFAGIAEDDGPESPTWVGLPPVAWDAPAGFATAANLPTVAGSAMIRDALTIAHRLPRLHTRLTEGQVPVWRARRIAQAVAGAPEDVAQAIDHAVVDVADRIGPITLDRLVCEAMIRLYPDEVEAASLEALDSRSVHFNRESISHTGLAWMNIHTDYADLDDLDQLLTDLAARLAETDPDAACESTQVRRAMAIGILADPARAHQLLHPEPDPTPDDTDGTPSNQPTRRRSGTTLVLRITDLALWGLDPVGSCDGGPVTLAERIASWCGRPATDLRVLPVLDPDAHHVVPGYEVPEPMKRHLGERDQHCLFPWCTRTARSCDHDHVIPRDDGGATCTCNLIPLCRHHHRLKTHAGYHATVVEPGLVWWTTPYGHEFTVDTNGTRPLQPHPPPDLNSCLQSMRGPTIPT